jgi:DNA-binding response OmpR family regulator
MRLLLIEDNQDLAKSLASGLGARGHHVDICGTAFDAAEHLATRAYNAVLLDLGLPDDDGLNLLKQIRANQNYAPVLILTARSSVGERVTGLRGGADDYIVKPVAVEELLARIEAVVRRQNQFGQVIEVGNLKFDSEHGQALVDGAPRILAVRETQILEALMRRKGLVVSKRALEQQLFGDAGDLGSNAIEVYVHRLRKTLLDSGASVAIHTIKGLGYMLAEKKSE